MIQVTYIQSKLEGIDLNVKVSDIDKRKLTFLLSPLLQLRQACCHPAVVRGNYLSMEKQTTTMDQLLEKLISETIKECQESHRKLICSLSGLAGLEILDSNLQKAAELYSESIQSWEEKEHNQKIKTDSLQVS